MLREPVYIIKASGERELWDSSKLERSLRAARADEDLVRKVVSHIEKDLHDGMRTDHIYTHAFSLLKKEHRPIAAEYSLKKAMMELGPSGFPFEHFIARFLNAKGYSTNVGVMVRGACVEHEVDVIAKIDDERILVEAKFHNSPSIKSDVKVALYVHARFLDIEKRFQMEEGQNGRFTRAWLITNTSFTNQAIQYGTCAGLALTGWNHPKGRTLQDLIQETQMHPLTCLTTLTRAQKTQLLNKGVVLCKDVVSDGELLQSLGVTRTRMSAILRESEILCGTKKNSSS